MGTVFSNIACRLIIAQMSSHRCEVVNMLLMLYAFFAGLSFLVPNMELMILRSLCLLVVVLHVHYGVCVKGRNQATLIGIFRLPASPTCSNSYGGKHKYTVY
ncbi:hypothetical protein Y032_0001g349 [Ancylostoma ceylanicum]|uniref:Uncharacterized protein n=1 Tax=Ancylostoma ceylanicum TaxID=53326 RepID=A0A016W3S9_9BILA|nr:hypothetical protein Y032_0001g349 [Ancylostoma ceylanicum]